MEYAVSGATFAAAQDQSTGGEVTTDGHVYLWLLLAFAACTLWEPAIELEEPHFTVDNVSPVS